MRQLSKRWSNLPPEQNENNRQSAKPAERLKKSYQK
jgi:hypothetical protein